MQSTMTMPKVSTPANSIWATIDRSMRDRESVYQRIREGQHLLAFARAMVLTVVLGGATFGAAVGSYRGGVQILFAALKFPIVLLLTAAVCSPTFTSLSAAVGRGAGKSPFLLAEHRSTAQPEKTPGAGTRRCW